MRQRAVFSSFDWNDILFKFSTLHFKKKIAIGFRGTKRAQNLFFLSGKKYISNIISFQSMKVRCSNICQVKIKRGTQFGRVLIAITFISTDLPLAAKEWNWISQMSFSKNELFKGSPKWITADFAEIFRRINVESRFWKYFPAKLYGTFPNKKEIYSLPLFDLIYSAGKTHKTSNYSQWSRLTVHTNLAYQSYPRNCISSVKRSQILIARIICWSLKIEDFPAATCFWVNQRTCFVNN